MVEPTEEEWKKLYGQIEKAYDAFLEEALGVKYDERMPMRIQLAKDILDICHTFYNDHDADKYETWGDDN